MFGLQGNNWIWILVAFFLLFGNDGCGFNFNIGNLFGSCGNNSMWIIALIAIFLLQNNSFAC